MQKKEAFLAYIFCLNFAYLIDYKHISILGWDVRQELERCLVSYPVAACAHTAHSSLLRSCTFIIICFHFTIWLVKVQNNNICV